MEYTILTVFKVMFWATIAIIILGTIIAIVHDYFKRKDLQAKLKRQQNRKARKKT